jgi:hypothetical protein
MSKSAMPADAALYVEPPLSASSVAAHTALGATHSALGVARNALGLPAQVRELGGFRAIAVLVVLFAQIF